MVGPFLGSNPPEGALAAAPHIGSSVAADYEQPHVRADTQRRAITGGAVNDAKGLRSDDKATPTNPQNTLDGSNAHLYEAFENGYHFPPKYSTKDSFRHGAVAFWKYFTTPLGFFVVIYALNVVAWGGMLFLLLCNASPAMCYPSCGDIDSPRRKWIEVDAQILNGLFCVTGFGLAPWRFRDMYWLLKFRIHKQHVGLRRLAGIHRSWFRLEGSQDLPPDMGPNHIPNDVSRDVIPYPEENTPDPPLSGSRAPPTRMWKLDFILWMNVWNTFFQCCLCGFMWGMDRYTRPSWATGLFVGLACVVGALGGIYMFTEGRAVKSFEGVALTDEDKAKLVKDREQGVLHYNNIKAKRPKDKATDPEKDSKGKRNGYNLNNEER